MQNPGATRDVLTINAHSYLQLFLYELRVRAGIFSVKAGEENQQKWKGYSSTK